MMLHQHQQQDAAVKPPDGMSSMPQLNMAGGNNSNNNNNNNPPLNLAQQQQMNSMKAGRQKAVGAAGGPNPAPAPAGQPPLPPEQSAQKCPRCDSINTKFCYYNNYSLSQPRHFCKNCRRYWTKGGALRNVPVGGGCRKNKRVKQRSPLDVATAASLVGVDHLADENGPMMMPGGGTASALLASCMNGAGGGGGAFAPGGLHHLGPDGGLSTLGLFTLPVSGGLAMGPFTPAGPGGAFDSSGFMPFKQMGDVAAIPPLLFQHHGSEFAPFYDHIHHQSTTSTAPTAMIPTLDHLSSFSASPAHNLLSSASTTSICTTTNPNHNHNPNSNPNTNPNSDMDAQLTLIHNSNQLMHSHHQDPRVYDETGHHHSHHHHHHHHQAANRGKSIISSLSDQWQHLQQQAAGAGGAAAAGTPSGAENFFATHAPASHHPENGLWNASWPEMQHALAGSSSTAGAILH